MDISRITEKFSCDREKSIKQPVFPAAVSTVELGFKELLNKEQIGNSEPFPMTNLPVYLINSDQIGMSEQFCDGQKVP